MKEVLVKVRLYGGIYMARAGKGKDAKHASSTMSGPIASQKAAAKFLQVDFHKVTLAKAEPGVFRATAAGSKSVDSGPMADAVTGHAQGQACEQDVALRSAGSAEISVRP